MSTPQVPMQAPQSVPPPAPPSKPTPLNLKNIQGDVISGLPKKLEAFQFFEITHPALFRKQLRLLVPLITKLEDVIEDRAKIDKSKAEAKAKGEQPPLLELTGTNIAFSKFGLTKFGIKPEDLGDQSFTNGQLDDAASLQDPLGPDGKPKWDGLFLHPIDGVIITTADSEIDLTIRKLTVDALFLGSTKFIKTLEGKVRPGKEKGHEHFGFNDGLSQPAIRGFGTPFKGQQPVNSGVILLGGDADPARPNPALAKDGSFLVFRKLNQRVPEFNKWLQENGDVLKGGPEFLGARIMGRWKSGTPIDLAPVTDIPEIATDPNKVNDFQYTFKNPDDQTDQTRCPFSAHLRKTNPRGDLTVPFGDGALAAHRIIRQGITFGPEVSKHEAEKKKTEHERGLYFVSYQSNIANGFAFIQKAWANAVDFPPQKPLPPGVKIGIEPIIGQDGTDKREATGFDPSAQATQFSFPTFVESRGGEYFFAPSISVLRDVIGDKIF